MRIGIDARMYSSSFTGIGRYTFELLRHLLKIDQKNQYVVFLNKKEYDTTHFAEMNIKKVLVKAPHYSLEEQTQFADKIIGQNLDLMHFTHFNAPLLYRKPFVVTIHDLTLSFYKGKKMTSLVQRTAYNLVIKNVIKNSRQIIAVSENTQNDIRRLFLVPKEKIRVIYEGIGSEFKKITDRPRLEATGKKYDLNKPFLLYTGVWRDHKNVTGLIQAFAKLVKEENLDLELVITGKDDPAYPEVKELPKTLGIAEKVHLTGLVSEPELIDLYNLAKVFVFPSFYEGFGLPPLESMACGTPVVASNSSSIPEVCGEKSCLYFDPKNTDEMAAQIQKALKDADLRADLIHAGAQWVQKYSWEKMAKETLEVYTDTVK